MGTMLYSIESRFKENESYYAKSQDFRRGAASVIDPHLLIEQRGWSPYCIDIEAGELVLVRVPETVDLSHAAFHFVTLFREAVAVATIPLTQVAALACDLPDPILVLIFSMGRCGTTLVSHALNGSPRAVSLSEPAVFDHGPLRTLAAKGDISGLIRDLCRLLFAGRSRSEADTLAVKFRSQALFITELFWQALPDARYVFMYRDAVSWGESFLQFLIDVGIPFPFDADGRAFHWQMISAGQPLAELGRYLDLDEVPISAEKLLAPGWSIHLEEYQRQLRAGVPFMALRYNELNRHREAELLRLFQHCGLPPDGVAGALLAFDEDSQKGTSIARKGDKRKFDAAGLEVYRATLARHPEFADPNLIVPDIYTS